MQKLPAPHPAFQPRLTGVLSAIVLVAAVAAAAPAAAQTTPSTPARASLPDGKPVAGSAANQLIERIQVEDADVRIEEARFGGETRRITVIPKGGFPSYDVRPSTGHSTWKILGF